MRRTSLLFTIPLHVYLTKEDVTQAEGGGGFHMIKFSGIVFAFLTAGRGLPLCILQEEENPTFVLFV